MAVEQPVTRPVERFYLLRWLQKNLFNSWFNTLLTLLALWLIYTILRPLLTWAFTTAEWQVITVNLRLILIGRFPAEEVWRVWTVVVYVAVLMGLSWGVWPPIMREVARAYGIGMVLLALLPFGGLNRIWLVLCSGLIFGGMVLGRILASEEGFDIKRWVGSGWVLVPPMTLWLLRGDGWLLQVIGTGDWGGLLLTLMMAVSSILFSFPLGVLLAVGRRSSLPIVRIFCTVVIEVVRGVPLVAVLFMFLIMLPLFLPGSETTDNIIRAIIGFTIFTATYIAENVRGGLQAIPNGQSEAAKAIGLNPSLTMVLILLPQALRIVIPSNVSQFISLFKDTSLVVAAGGGILELLGTGRSVLGQSEFLGLQSEVLLFVALVYWIFAYSLTYLSKRLEAQGKSRKF